MNRIDDESLAVYAAGGGPGDTQALATELIALRNLICPTDGPTLHDRLVGWWDATGNGETIADILDDIEAVTP